MSSAALPPRATTTVSMGATVTAGEEPWAEASCRQNRLAQRGSCEQRCEAA